MTAQKTLTLIAALAAAFSLLVLHEAHATTTYNTGGAVSENSEVTDNSLSAFVVSSDTNLTVTGAAG